MNEWNIQSRARACEACQRPFADQQTYHTLLFDLTPELRRSDVCETCWQERYADASIQKGLISRWQGTYELPPPPAEVIKKENAETLLKKLIELNDPRHIPAGYILAVMLERKRLLKVKEQIVREGQRIFIYEQPKTGDVFTITDPNLRLDQLDEVQRDVAHLLEHGLNPPDATEAAANPNALIASDAEPASPSPGGEGRGEGELAAETENQPAPVEAAATN